MTFVCFNCNCSFKSNIKIYNYFPPIKIDLLCAIHSLNTNKYALPFILANKYCKCDLAKIEMLKHNDGGDLLEGDKLDKKVIFCNKCYGVFNMDSFDWACPVCKKGFGIKKVNIYEYRTKDYNIKNKNINKNQLNSSKIFSYSFIFLSRVSAFSIFVFSSTFVSFSCFVSFSGFVSFSSFVLFSNFISSSFWEL